MSLMSADSPLHDVGVQKFKLRTADQDPRWLARTTDVCWAQTRIDITTVRDADCGGAAVAPLPRGRRAADADEDEKVGLLP